VFLPVFADVLLTELDRDGGTKFREGGDARISG
jgi:hypothetical protein